MTRMGYGDRRYAPQKVQPRHGVTNYVREGEMTYPTIHVGGTSSDELVKQTTEALSAAENLTIKLSLMCPHPRDYPQGLDAWNRAWFEHAERVNAARRIERELRDWAKHVAMERGQ